MWSPTLAFSPSYLLNPKPGEKRNFFNRSYNHHKVVGPEHYYLVAEFPPKPLDSTMTNHFLNMSKFGSQIPFKVPPMKIPPLVGGFVGANCESFREDTRKSDILTNKCKDIFYDTFSNMRYEDLVSNCNSRNSALNHAAMNAKCTQEAETDVLPEFCPHQKLPTDESKTSPSLTTNSKGSSASQHIPNKSLSAVCQEDQEKPPIKKPKLAIKTTNKPSRKKGRRKKKCKKFVQSDTDASLPGYDPSQTSFEAIEEGDCGIVLTNRFAPLENSTDFNMWCESPADTDSSILNMLNEMHLGEMEVDFDSSASITELCDVRSYKPDNSCKADCTQNSSIAFILSGNDDIASDSEDDSFGNDFEDVQWRSFKADFEFFQENVMEDIAKACESVSIDDLRFQATLEVVESNNALFINDIECFDDSSEELRQINQRWNEDFRKQSKEPRSVKVHFAPDCSLAQVYSIPSGPEEREARKSQWDQCYLDRCRFQNRIRELEPRISLCFRPQHRKAVFERLYGSEIKQ